MKKYLLLILFIAFSSGVFAEHIKGGEMFYTYLGDGASPNTSRYTVTLKLYIDCNAIDPRQLDPSVPLTIFDRANNSVVGSPVTAPMSQERFLQFDPLSNPCISNPPTDICYRVRYYTTTITLPVNAAGYTISFQRCCRIDNIVNLVQPSNDAGATYMCEIPGNVPAVTPEAYKNSSPIYVANEVAAICANSGFTFTFAADETDGDSVSYSLCSGFLGASPTNPGPPTAAPPPYQELNYNFPFSGSQPLGALATMNPKTGLITGIAPGVTGQYVLTACAYEYRQGRLINIHRKDIHVSVSNCVPLKAILKPNYAYCDDFLVNFKNEQFNPPGSQFIWDYGDGSKRDTTNDPEGKVSHQYADTGVYKVKLKVILAGGQCVDSTVTDARVFPGFFPGFTVQGTCILLPLQFNDTTRTRYGTVNKWRWNFGDQSTLADTAKIKSPNWKYATTGFKTVELIVESDKGCIDTVLKQVEVRDKPPINFAFKDTLICSVDTLQLNATGIGVFSWTPNYNILNQNTNNPLVFPKTTTYYTLTLNENGCINTDSLRVRVVDFVSLDAGPDTTICTTDTITLFPITDGLQFNWTPALRINDPLARNPKVSPLTTTTYQVRANIGKCFKVDDITIRTVPYPVSIAGADTIICFEDTAQINARIVGSRFAWSPTNTLIAPNTLNPRAFPLQSTSYTLTVYDTLGCPKPGLSSINVNVRPKILAFAGNDTSVVIGQPLQLNATGAPLFLWAPPSYLNDPTIPNPIAILNDNFTYFLKAYTPEGCAGYDTINIKVFKTNPDIFVPNAFSPNGRNRILRPIPVGISRLDYFRIYNRWGQLIFQTNQTGVGWDGRVAGRLQDNGTFVWMAQGVDYTGKVIQRKGTAILIR